ncbi:MAG: glycosyltransferase, partial [Vulcanimicrobiaceae bacterium]
FYTDVAMADLFRAATALVSPYRGEGFGLPILEAMACGIATIATRGGASDDFTTDETTIHVDATRVTLGTSYGGFELVDEAFLLEPSEEQVGAAMRRLFERPGDAQAMGAKAAEHARNFTWERGAQKALAQIKALADGRPLAARRSEAPSGIDIFELRIASRGGEDGVLLELFRRLGTEDPFFVECVSTGESPTISVFLSRSLGWRGAVLEGDAAVYAEFAARLSGAGVADEFELLALPRDADPAWSRLGAFRPKAIVIAGGDAPRALAASHGYTSIGTESRGSSTFFVRDDLLERSRFPAALSW